MGIGAMEWLLIFLIVLLLFGGRKLPELARGLGKGMREFKRELGGVKDELEKEQPGQTASKDDAPISADKDQT